MIGLFLYVLIGVFGFGVFVLLNKRHEWITKTSIRGDSLQPLVLFLGTIFWPFALIAIGIVLLVNWAIKTFIPE